MHHDTDLIKQHDYRYISGWPYGPAFTVCRVEDGVSKCGRTHEHSPLAYTLDMT